MHRPQNGEVPSPVAFQPRIRFYCLTAKLPQLTEKWQIYGRWLEAGWCCVSKTQQVRQEGRLQVRGRTLGKHCVPTRNSYLYPGGGGGWGMGEAAINHLHWSPASLLRSSGWEWHQISITETHGRVGFSQRAHTPGPGHGAHRKGKTRGCRDDPSGHVRWNLLAIPYRSRAHPLT